MLATLPPFPPMPPTPDFPQGEYLWRNILCSDPLKKRVLPMAGSVSPCWIEALRHFTAECFMDTCSSSGLNAGKPSLGSRSHSSQGKFPGSGPALLMSPLSQQSWSGFCPSLLKNLFFNYSSIGNSGWMIPSLVLFPVSSGRRWENY